jgi:hypothetical protein
MNNDEFKTMLAALTTVQQITVWGTVWWRWLFRQKGLTRQLTRQLTRRLPQQIHRRSWSISEQYVVMHLLG